MTEQEFYNWVNKVINNRPGVIPPNEVYLAIWNVGYQAAVRDKFKIREQRAERSESWPHPLGRGVE